LSRPDCHGTEALNVVCHNLRAMGHIQPCHHNRKPDWKTISAASGSTKMLNSAAGVQFPSPIAAHNHNTGDFAVQFRMAVQQQRDVGLRSGCHQRDGFSAFTQHLRHQLHGGAVLRREPGSGSAGPSSPLSPCTLSAIISSRISGFRAAGNIRAFEQRQHAQHVTQGFIRRLVSGRRGDGFYVEFREASARTSAIASS
jgi:hypothetical protein